jgi:tetratricopeptide (TPR) repeat protein
LVRRGGDLSPEERRHVEASLALRQQEDAERATRRNAEHYRRRQRRVLAATAAGLVVALVLASVTVGQWRSANMQRARAEKTVAVVAQTEHGLVIQADKYLSPTIRYGAPIDKAQVPLLRGILEVVLKTATLLAKSGETSAALRSDQGEALNITADLLRRLGNSTGAREAARQAHDIFEALAAADPGNIHDQHNLAISYERIGDTLRAQQHPDQTLAAYRRAAEIIERLTRINPDNTAVQNGLAISYERIGDALWAQQHPDQALAAYRREAEIAERLTQINPRNADWQRVLFYSRMQIGEIYVNQTELVSASHVFQKAKKIALLLEHISADRARAARDLQWVTGNLAKIAEAEHEAERQSRDIFKAFAAADPSNTHDQHNLAISHEQIGNALQTRQHPGQVLADYRRETEIDERRHEVASPTRAKASAWSRPRRGVAITALSRPRRCARLEPNPAWCRRALPEPSLPGTDRGPAAGPLRRFLAHIFGIQS